MKNENLKRAAPYIGIPVLAIALLIAKAEKLDPFILLQYEILLIFGYAAAFGDFKNKRIPNKIVLGMLTVWVLTMTPKLFLDTEAALLLLKESAIGSLIGGGLFMLIYIVSRKGLGGGDVKFMAAAGLYMGFARTISAMLYGAVLSAITVLVLLALKKVGIKDSIPLLPFLYIGILIILFF